MKPFISSSLTILTRLTDDVLLGRIIIANDITRAYILYDSESPNANTIFSIILITQLASRLYVTCANTGAPEFIVFVPKSNIHLDGCMYSIYMFSYVCYLIRLTYIARAIAYDQRYGAFTIQLLMYIVAYAFRIASGFPFSHPVLIDYGLRKSFAG